MSGAVAIDIEAHRAALEGHEAAIFNCASLDKLRAKAAAGDAAALALLASFAPRDASPAIRVRLRDAQIRSTASWLQTRLPDLTANGIAVMLAAAGDALRSGRHLSARKPFANLSDDERAELERCVREALADAAADRWPRRRQLWNIMSGEVGNVSPLEIANASDGSSGRQTKAVICFVQRQGGAHERR